MASGIRYYFDICYMDGNCYATHEEYKRCANDDEALSHFRDLLKKFGVDGRSYYLCRWCEAADKKASDAAIAADVGGV